VTRLGLQQHPRVVPHPNTAGTHLYLSPGRGLVPCPLPGVVGGWGVLSPSPRPPEHRSEGAEPLLSPRGHLSADAKAPLAPQLPWQPGDRNAMGSVERGGSRGHSSPARPSQPQTPAQRGPMPTSPTHRKKRGLSKLGLFQMLKDYRFLPLFLN